MLCVECRIVPLTGRSDRLTCSQECRQARARFRRHFATAGRAASPLRLAYADPPYPGKARLYASHPDYRGEVDHRALLSELQGYDGWALSTDEPGLRSIQPHLADIEHRVGVWVRGARPGAARGVRSSWEAVVYRACRDDVSSPPATANPNRVIGAKPAPFWSWMFQLVDARPGDVFTDLYVGSGAGARAWSAYTEKAHG